MRRESFVCTSQQGVRRTCRQRLLSAKSMHRQKEMPKLVTRNYRQREIKACETPNDCKQHLLFAVALLVLPHWASPYLVRLHQLSSHWVLTRRTPLHFVRNSMPQLATTDNRRCRRFISVRPALKERCLHIGGIRFCSTSCLWSSIADNRRCLRASVDPPREITDKTTEAPTVERRPAV